MCATTSCCCGVPLSCPAASVPPLRSPPLPHGAGPPHVGRQRWSGGSPQMPGPILGPARRVTVGSVTARRVTVSRSSRSFETSLACSGCARTDRVQGLESSKWSVGRNRRNGQCCLNGQCGRINQRGQSGQNGQSGQCDPNSQTSQSDRCVPTIEAVKTVTAVIAVRTVKYVRTVKADQSSGQHGQSGQTVEAGDAFKTVTAAIQAFQTVKSIQNDQGQ